MIRFVSQAARESATVTQKMVDEFALVSQEEGAGVVSFWRAMTVGTGAGAWTREAGNLATVNGDGKVPLEQMNDAVCILVGNKVPAANLTDASGLTPGSVKLGAQTMGSGAKTFTSAIAAGAGVDCSDGQYLKGKHKSNDGTVGVTVGPYVVGPGDTIQIKDGLVTTYTQGG